MPSPWRPGGDKHDVAHRVWLLPDPKLDTRKNFCHKCLRPRIHPIHDKKYRTAKDWFGWRNTNGMSNRKRRNVEAYP